MTYISFLKSVARSQLSPNYFTTKCIAFDVFSKVFTSSLKLEWPHRIPAPLTRYISRIVHLKRSPSRMRHHWYSFVVPTPRLIVSRHTRSKIICGSNMNFSDSYHLVVALERGVVRVVLDSGLWALHLGPVIFTQTISLSRRFTTDCMLAHSTLKADQHRYQSQQRQHRHTESKHYSAAIWSRFAKVTTLGDHFRVSIAQLL